MNKREVRQAVLEHRRPPYVPWSFGFTKEAKGKLAAHLLQPKDEDLDEAVGNHLLELGSR